VAIALQGVGNTLYYLSTTPFMAGVSTTDDRPYLFSLNVALQTLSSAAGNLLAGFLPGWLGLMLAVPVDGPQVYRSVLLLSLAAGSLSIVPLILMRDQKEPAGASAQMTSVRKVVRALALPVVRKLALPNLLIGIGAAILIPYMNVFFKERFGLPDSMLGLLFGLSAILTAAGTLLGPRLAERLGSKIRAVVFTQGLSIVFLLLLGFWPGLIVAAGAHLVRAALMNMSAPLYSAYGMERAPLDQRALVSSVLYLTWQTGWAFGPYVSGFVQERWGFGPLFVTTSIVYMLAVTATWAFFHSGQETAGPAAAARSAPGCAGGIGTHRSQGGRARPVVVRPGLGPDRRAGRAPQRAAREARPNPTADCQGKRAPSRCHCPGSALDVRSGAQGQCGAFRYPGAQ